LAQTNGGKKYGACSSRHSPSWLPRCRTQTRPLACSPERACAASLDMVSSIFESQGLPLSLMYPRNWSCFSAVVPVATMLTAHAPVPVRLVLCAPLHVRPCLCACASMYVVVSPRPSALAQPHQQPSLASTWWGLRFCLLLDPNHPNPRSWFFGGFPLGSHGGGMPARSEDSWSTGGGGAIMIPAGPRGHNS
jgi:hypothetical protein